MGSPVLIDCDPGTDDAIALAMAAVAPELSIEAVTTVAGNQTLEKTTQNALRVLSLCDRPAIPVSSGGAEPIVQELRPAAEVHGQSGLAGIDLPPASFDADDTHAVERIREVAATVNGLSVITIGPLTNVAWALRRYPDLSESIEEIIIMGGSIAGGNVTPAAEFNVHTDPEATQIVFDAPVPVTMVGLDVTRAARIDAETNDRIRAVGSPVTDAIADLIDHLRTVHGTRYGWTSAPVHDALAVAYEIDSDLLTTEEMHVDVERDGRYTRGATICDRLRTSDRAANVAVATDVMADRFRSTLLDRLARFA